MITIDLTVDSDNERDEQQRQSSAQSQQPAPLAPSGAHQGPAAPSLAPPREAAAVAVTKDVHMEDVAVEPAVGSDNPAGGNKENAEPQLDENEELRITKCKVDIWNEDLPHLRHQCGAFPFSVGRNADNAKSCDNCYCYVCDKKAKECTLWGDGSDALHHCNATDHQVLYKNLKRQHGQPPSQTPRPPSTTDHHHPFFTPRLPGYDSEEDEEDEEDDYGGFPYGRFGHRHMSMMPWHRRRSPSPPPPPKEPLEPLPNPAEDTNMTELGAIRLRCKAEGSGARSIDLLKLRLMPDGAYLRPSTSSRPCSYFQDKPPSEAQLHIGNLFKDGALTVIHDEPPEAPDAVAPLRTVPLLVVHGSRPPSLYGVEVNKDAKVEEALAKAQESHSLFPNGTEGLVIGRAFPNDDGTLPYRAWTHVCRDSTAFAPGRYLLVQVPTEVPGCGNKTYTIIVSHRLQLTRKSKSNPSGVKGYRHLRGMFTVLRAPSSASRITEAIVSDAARFKRQTGGSLKSSHIECFTDQHGSTIRNLATYLGQRRPGGSDCVQLTAVWSEKGSGRISYADWEKLDVHPSASPSVLTASKELHKRESDRASARLERIRKERRQVDVALEELISAQRCCPPSDKQGQSSSPLARVRVELEASEAGSALGTATLRIFVWKARTCLSATDVLPGRKAYSQVLFGSATNNTGVFLNVLGRLALDAPGVAAATEEIKQWQDPSSSIEGLLKRLETGEIDAAAQPPGLGVTLHPYQLQSLGFMQRAEKGPGLERLLWFPVATPSGGETWWWSPVLNEARKAPPQDASAWGGFLCETMGLGKTVEVLALILSDRGVQPPVATVPSTLYPTDHPRHRASAAAPASATTGAYSSASTGAAATTGAPACAPASVSTAAAAAAAAASPIGAPAAASGAAAATVLAPASAVAAPAGTAGAPASTSAAVAPAAAAATGPPASAVAAAPAPATPSAPASASTAGAAAAATAAAAAVGAPVSAAPPAPATEAPVSTAAASAAAAGVAVSAAAAAPPPPPAAAASALVTVGSSGSAAAAGPATAGGRICSNATLVVCAVSLVGQWVAEAKAKAGGSLRIYQYHGSSRLRDPVKLASNYDLVVTTYGIVGVGWKGSGDNPPQSPLHDIQWHRVVFDESHTLKNPAVGHSRACTALRAARRWACTGTPISSDVMELYGQFAALRLAPFSSQAFFGRFKYSLGPQSWKSHGSPAPLYYALSKVMVRHTKHQKTGGQTVLQLPALTRESVAVAFSPEELRLYRAEHGAACAAFQGFLCKGAAHISKHMLQIMSLLVPLRRIASGGKLAAGDLASMGPSDGAAGVEAEEQQQQEAQKPPAQAAASSSGQAQQQQKQQDPMTAKACPICHNGMEAPLSTACGHLFCRECLMGALAGSPSCPLCARPVQEAELHLAPAAKGAPGAADRHQQHHEVPPCESKLKALVAELRAMRARDPGAKALVFSQFTGTIEWLKERLPDEGFGFRTIDGAMALNKRTQAIADFQGDPPTTVFLLSMRAGAVGINLTAASHVFLLEPALNPALAEQAIGRAWRMGQQRPVVAKTLFVKGSVEENIMKLNERRAGGGGKQQEEATGGGAAAPSGAEQQQLPRASSAPDLDKQDANVTGCLKSDRQELRMEELEILFGATVGST